MNFDSPLWNVLILAVAALIGMLLLFWSKLRPKPEEKGEVPAPPTQSPVAAARETVPEIPSEDAVYSGSLRLKNVDEPTAALIMAIVSDESGIPLNELCFRSIARLNEAGRSDSQYHTEGQVTG